MGIERQNIQMRLAFPEGDWGETPGTSREGTEMPVAVCAPESPAEETAQPAEPPCTDPYARWCDRESLRRPTYVDWGCVMRAGGPAVSGRYGLLTERLTGNRLSSP